MKLLHALLLWTSMSCMLFAQNSYYEVVAESGDGIYSILRKQGLDPVTHYEKFVALNVENIKNGSELHVGRVYKIPQAEDSFKKTGLKVRMTDGSEWPIFDEELGQMSLKDRTLKNAVYYLISEDQTEENKFTEDITKNLAAQLLVHGAKVYIFEYGTMDLENRPKFTEKQKMGQYIDEINERYIKHLGKYQRLLIIRANGLIKNGNMDVAVYHHGKSKKGKRFAENIQNVFKKNSTHNTLYKDVNMILKDENTLFLATNTLPSVSLLTLDSTSKKEGIPVRSDKKSFANWITNGILRDYAELTIEE